MDASQQPVNTASYSEAVPSVMRALDVVELLAEKHDQLTLSQLSRELQISPSSLSAILRTLARRGYAAHDARTGRYRLGARFAALTDSNATRDAAEAIMALGRTASGASGPSPELRYALGLAARHLADALLESAERGMPERADLRATWDAEASGPLQPAELTRFLDDEWLATLSCLAENGSPYSVPVWYLWEDERFWVVPRAHSEWARLLACNPRISLAVSEPSPPLRRVLVEGDATPLTGPGSSERASALSARIAIRYLGSTAGSYLEATASQPLQVFMIVPSKLVTWRGLAPHPRYQNATDAGSTSDYGVA